MKKTQQFLAKLKLPTQDNYALEPTKKRFPDGGQYRFEIPSVEGPRVFRAVLESAKEHKVPVHRVSQGSGVLLLGKRDVEEMARIGKGERIEVCLFVGPRATFETGAQAASAAGKKCTSSTTQSVLSTRRSPRRSCVFTTAQSSPGPTTTAFLSKRRGKSWSSNWSSPRSPSFMEKKSPEMQGR